MGVTSISEGTNQTSSESQQNQDPKAITSPLRITGLLKSGVRLPQFRQVEPIDQLVSVCIKKQLVTVQFAETDQNRETWKIKPKIFPQLEKCQNKRSQPAKDHTT